MTGVLPRGALLAAGWILLLAGWALCLASFRDPGTPSGAVLWPGVAAIACGLLTIWRSRA